MEVVVSGSNAFSSSRWRKWLVSLAGAITSLAALSLKVGMIPPSGLGRTGAFVMIAVAIPLGMRAYVHVRIRYVACGDAVEAPCKRRKRRWLGGVVCLNFAIAASLAAAGAWYSAYPNNLQELMVASAGLVLIALSSNETLRLTQYLGLPRGSDAIGSCPAVRWVREFAERFGDVPGVSQLDSLWDKRTSPHRVSWLIVVLLSLLVAAILIQIVAIAPDIGRYFTS